MNAQSAPAHHAKRAVFVTMVLMGVEHATVLAIFFGGVIALNV